MKIGILVVDISLNGGLELASLRLFRLFQGAGIYVRIFSLLNSNNFIDDSIDVTFLRSVDRKNYFFEFAEDILKLKITHLIVQLNDPWCRLANVRLYGQLSKNVKIYAVVHGSPRSFLKRYRVEKGIWFIIFFLKFLKTMLINRQRAKCSFYQLAKEGIFFVTLSKGNHDELKKYYKIDSHIIYNAHMVSCQIDSSFNKKDQILFVGRFTKVKGVFFLIDVWNRMHHNGWKLILVGDGEERNNILAYIKNKKIKNIILTRWLDDNKVNAILMHSKVIVLPSLFEGFPNIFYEALINNVVILCTRYDGFSDELVKDGTNGIVCRHKKSDLKKSLEKLINDPVYLYYLMHNNSKILSEYNAIDVLSQWLNILSLSMNTVA